MTGPMTVCGAPERGEAREPGVSLPPDFSLQLATEELLLLRPGEDSGANPDLWLYRDRTVSLLRRYLRFSIEVGRLPSLLGREFFRTRVTSYHAQTFEDAVIFVHDVERSLEELNGTQKLMIGMVVLREYSHEETARLLRCTRRTILRSYLEAVDRTSEIFLEREILAPLPKPEPKPPEACQGGQLEVFSANV